MDAPGIRAYLLFTIMETQDLKSRIKELIVEELMLDLGEGELADDAPLFDPDGLGLDSVDALQLVVVIEKNFGFKIENAGKAAKILSNVNTIAAAIEEHRAG